MYVYACVNVHASANNYPKQKHRYIFDRNCSLFIHNIAIIRLIKPVFCFCGEFYDRRCPVQMENNLSFFDR